MSIVGLDLAGVETKPSGFCVLKGLTAETYLVFSNEDILGKTVESKPKIVTIDAPLSLPAGRKSIEQRTKVHLRECDKASGVSTLKESVHSILSNSQVFVLHL